MPPLYHISRYRSWILMEVPDVILAGSLSQFLAHSFHNRVYPARAKTNDVVLAVFERVVIQAQITDEPRQRIHTWLSA